MNTRFTILGRCVERQSSGLLFCFKYEDAHFTEVQIADSENRAGSPSSEQPQSSGVGAEVDDKTV